MASNKPDESSAPGTSIFNVFQQQQQQYNPTTTQIISQAIALAADRQAIDQQMQNTAVYPYQIYPHQLQTNSDPMLLQQPKVYKEAGIQPQFETPSHLSYLINSSAETSAASIRASEFPRGNNEQTSGDSSGDLSTSSISANESAGSDTAKTNAEQRILCNLGPPPAGQPQRGTQLTGPMIPSKTEGYPIPINQSTPLNTSSNKLAHGRGFEMQEFPFMPGIASQHNSGFSIGYSPFIGGIPAQMPMPSNLPYASLGFGTTPNLQQSAYPTAFNAMQAMPYGIQQQQPWLYGHHPYAAVWPGRQQNISGSSFDSGIMGNISGTSRSNVSNIMQQAVDTTPAAKNISTDSGSSTESSGEKKTGGVKKEINGIQEIQRKLKPFIKREIETDANTNVQRERDIDLEHQYLDDVRVAGRLAPLGLNRKYYISLAEVYRRIKLPENLNTSALCAILRLAKTKDGGNSFRSKLQNSGLIVKSGRRKSVPPTVFSVLCEGEALQISEDLTYLTSRNFPCKTVALIMNRNKLPSRIRTPENVSYRLSCIQHSKNILTEYMEMIANGIKDETQPLSEEHEILHQDSPLDAETRDGMIRYGRITHCFGNRALMLCHQMFMNTLEGMERELKDGSNYSAGGSDPRKSVGGADLGLASTSAYTPQLFPNVGARMNSSSF